MKEKGRVALISGGGRGAGRGIALALARQGVDVALNYRRDDAAAAATLREVEALGVRAKTYRASVESWDEDRAMVDAVVADFGHVDILVNNAGIASRGQPVFDTEPAELERVVRVHAFGSFYLSKLVLPSMRTRPRGDIIMISSVMTNSYSANALPYAMGKAGMEAVALVLAKEERKHNIRVNVIQPGVIESEMGVRLMKATRGTGDWHELAGSLPFGRPCTPEDIGSLVCYLVSDAASYITGARIPLDGAAAVAG